MVKNIQVGVIMTVTMSGQTILFAQFLLCGTTLGILFDIFRIVRKIIKHGVILTAFEDIIYCILSIFIFIMFSIKFNYGTVRWFMVAGCLSGAIIYFNTFGKLVIKVADIIIDTAKKPLIFTVNLSKNILKPFKKFYKQKLLLKKK